MNYIRHLQLIYQRFIEDERLNPSHISLYMAIFQEWNTARFPGELYINRQQLMLSSKVRSQSGYHRCIRELDVFGYLQYLPSHNPYQGSRVKMFTFRTSSEQADDHRDPILEQVAAHYYPKYEPVDEPYINSNKQKTITNRKTNTKLKRLVQKATPWDPKCRPSNSTILTCCPVPKNNYE